MIQQSYQDPTETKLPSNHSNARDIHMNIRKVINDNFLMEKKFKIPDLSPQKNRSNWLIEANIITKKSDAAAQ